MLSDLALEPLGPQLAEPRQGALESLKLGQLRLGLSPKIARNLALAYAGPVFELLLRHAVHGIAEHVCERHARAILFCGYSVKSISG